MKLIGITGGIGSGKSTIAKVFMSIGYPVYNSDTRAKELINSNEKLINSIKLSFGDDLYNSQGLDRKKMASIVFNNPEKLELLNSIIHPTVGKDFEKWIDLQNTSFILKEAAILFETGIYRSLHKTILVSAPQETRIERVIKRDNTNQEEVLSRMNNQWSEEKKTELADYVIDNSGNKLVIPQVLEIIKQILK
jgi:dephospho-CoA kinase|tara:strand:- start:350 stop:928 length:579 start_codon:yes stop_codon:yes gene_type:complete